MFHISDSLRYQEFAVYFFRCQSSQMKSNKILRARQGNRKSLQRKARSITLMIFILLIESSFIVKRIELILCVQERIE